MSRTFEQACRLPALDGVNHLSLHVEHADVEYALLGWPGDEPTLRLDHERFAYAGKFVISSTGKAVVREGETVIAAAAFDPDRTDDGCLRVRYVTVRDDRRNSGIGSRLLRFVVVRAFERGYDEVKAGVNNPFAYETFYRAGLAYTGERGYDEVKAGVNNPFAYETFYRAGLAYTGERTGLAELVCSTAADRTADRYRAGLFAYRERDLSEAEMAFLDAREDSDPPPVVESPAVES